MGAEIVNTGLVLKFNEPSLLPVVISGPAGNRPSYVISVGTVVYPLSAGNQEIVIVNNQEIIYDFSDSADLNFDYPRVPNPAITLVLNLADELLLNGTLIPPALSQLRDSNLNFEYQGQTASYLITSLQVAPEPSTLVMLSIALAFWMRSRHRV